MNDALFAFILNVALLIGTPLAIVFYYLPNLIYDRVTIFCPDGCRARNTPGNHKRKVRRIQDQVKTWNLNGRKKQMCTARPTWKTAAMRNVNKSKFTQIELDMNDIIEIDEDNMIIKVEPGIGMGTLTHKLLPLGYTIPVVPEVEILTVGGLINGAGLESSSHKYSIIAFTALEYELVVPDGSVITCSEKENADIFHSVPMSYGTLGFLTSVTFPLIKAGKYVKLEYHASTSIAQTQELLQRSEYEFIEGIAYGKHNAVVMLGNFADKAERGKINYINRWYKPWFYQHPERFLNKTKVVVEYIPTRDYYHRHTRGMFWVIGSAASVTRTRWYMFLFGWIFPLNMQFGKMLACCLWTPMVSWVQKRAVGQDFVVAIDDLEESLCLSHDFAEVYPIWLCPCKMIARPGLIAYTRKEGKEDYYVDIGIYGMPPGKKLKAMGDGNAAVRLFEQYCLKKNGFQGMYADCFLTKDEFYTMFSPTLYNKVRSELNCLDAFPDAYEKSVSLKWK